MRFSRIAEAALKEVVAPEGDEGLLLLRLVSRQRSPHRLGKPIIPDGAGHAPKEIKGLIMTFEQGLLLLVGESHQKRYLGEVQPPDKELDGERTALHYHPGFAEVDLGIHAGIISQRYEHRALPGTMFVHILPDSRLAAAISMLLDESVIDSPTGVTLLNGAELILGQPPVNNGDEPAEYRPGPGPAQLVVGKTPVPNGCPDRAPVMVSLPGDLTYTLALNKEGPANLLFLVHFKHLFPPVTGFLSSIPDSTSPVGVFSPITALCGWVLFILAFTFADSDSYMPR